MEESETGLPWNKLSLNPIYQSDQKNLGTLRNKIFDQGDIGIASYHFLETGPYICYSKAKQMGWLLDDGTTYPPEKKFFENWTYNQESRTFKGRITWSPLTFGNNNRWEYTMVFDE